MNMEFLINENREIGGWSIHDMRFGEKGKENEKFFYCKVFEKYSKVVMSSIYVLWKMNIRLFFFSLYRKSSFLRNEFAPCLSGYFQTNNSGRLFISNCKKLLIMNENFSFSSHKTLTLLLTINFMVKNVDSVFNSGRKKTFSFHYHETEK